MDIVALLEVLVKEIIAAEEKLAQSQILWDFRFLS